MFDCREASFLGFGKVQLDIMLVRCPEEREYFGRLSPLIVFLKRASDLSDQVDVYKV